MGHWLSGGTAAIRWDSGYQVGQRLSGGTAAVRPPACACSPGSMDLAPAALATERQSPDSTALALRSWSHGDLSSRVGALLCMVGALYPPPPAAALAGHLPPRQPLRLWVRFKHTSVLPLSEQGGVPCKASCRSTEEAPLAPPAQGRPLRPPGARPCRKSKHYTGR